MVFAPFQPSTPLAQTNWIRANTIHVLNIAQFAAVDELIKVR
jgi:hypothetical protein